MQRITNPYGFYLTEAGAIVKMEGHFDHPRRTLFIDDTGRLWTAGGSTTDMRPEYLDRELSRYEADRIMERNYQSSSSYSRPTPMQPMSHMGIGRHTTSLDYSRQRASSKDAEAVAVVGLGAILGLGLLAMFD